MVFPESSRPRDDFVAVDLSGVDIDLSPSADDIDDDTPEDAEVRAVLDQE